MRRTAIFLDKDGTLVEDVPYNVDPDRVRLLPGVREALHALREAGHALVVITNQSGVARGYFAEQALRAVEARLAELIGLPLDGFHYCPHHPEGQVSPYAVACGCRKPEAGLIERAARELDIDLGGSWLVGDILNDVEAGRRAGCRTILLDNGGETEWLLTPQRRPHHTVASFAEAADIILAQRRPREASALSPALHGLDTGGSA